jgi:hypothetical protein
MEELKQILIEIQKSGKISEQHKSTLIEASSIYLNKKFSNTKCSRCWIKLIKELNAYIQTTQTTQTKPKKNKK